MGATSSYLLYMDLWAKANHSGRLCSPVILRFLANLYELCILRVIRVSHMSHYSPGWAPWECDGAPCPRRPSLGLVGLGDGLEDEP